MASLVYVFPNESYKNSFDAHHSYGDIGFDYTQLDPVDWHMYGKTIYDMYKTFNSLGIQISLVSTEYGRTMIDFKNPVEDNLMSSIIESFGLYYTIPRSTYEELFDGQTGVK